MTAQLPIDFGRKLRDRGISQAVKHADAVHNEWSDKAYDLFKVFVSKQDKPFKVEEFREFTRGSLQEPPSLRSFGALPLRAAREGLIRKVGTTQVKNAKSHMANAAVWERIS